MSDDDTPNAIDDLLRSKPRVVNVGLASFADDLRAQAARVIDVDWKPPAGGDPRLADLLSKLGA